MNDHSDNLRLSSPAEVIASRSLTWLVQNLTHFDPLTQSSFPDEWHQTLIAEIALLSYLCCRRCPTCKTDHRLVECLDWVETIYRNPFFHEHIYHSRPAFAAHLTMWLALENRDVESLIPRERIQWLVNHSNVTSTERLPYRTLELRYLLELGDFEHNLPDLPSLFRQTILGRGFDSIFLTDYDIYSITHSIFYITDFGRQRPAFLDLDHIQVTLSLLDVLLGMSIHVQNWDLVGELILSCYCLEPHERTWTELGWEALSVAQELSDVDDSSAYQLSLFRQRYHLMLVTVLAGYLGHNGLGVRQR